MYFQTIGPNLVNSNISYILSISIYNCRYAPYTYVIIIFSAFAEDAEMLQLTPEHAQIIHDLYPANQIECVEVFEKLFEKLPSYGVFSASGDLAAWIIQSYYGALISMQTKPDYRRKGYGLILAKHLTKVVTKRGYLPFVVIRPENDASKSLYTKLGFKKHFQTVRAILKPNDITNNGKGGGTDEEDY